MREAPAALPAPLSVPGACAERRRGWAGGGTKAARCAATPGRVPAPARPPPAPAWSIGMSQRYPGALPAPRCAWISLGVCHCAMTERTRAPPPVSPPHLSHRHEIWHLGRGKGRLCCPPPPRPQRVSVGGRRAPAGSPRAPPPRAPTPPPLLSGALGGRRPGARGPAAAPWGRSWVPLSREGDAVPRTCRSGKPRGAGTPQGRAALPGSVRETRVLCVPGRAGSRSISLCRGEAIYQEEDCVRAC